MINLIDADKALKQLYLSMVKEELSKVTKQPKAIEQTEQEWSEEDEIVAQGSN